MAIVRVGEIELDYERSGSGPPLLMIMGMSGTAAALGRAVPGGAAQRLRGDRLRPPRRSARAAAWRGRSRSLRWPQDAAGLLGALEIDSAHVLGISMGGMVAQELALGAPRARAHADARLHLLRRRGQRADEPRGVRAARRARWPPATASARCAPRGRSTSLRASPPTRRPARASGRSRCERRRGPAGDRWRRCSAIAGHDTSERLGALALPTLVMHGTLDQMLPGRRTAAWSPG